VSRATALHGDAGHMGGARAQGHLMKAWVPGLGAPARRALALGGHRARARPGDAIGARAGAAVRNATACRAPAHSALPCACLSPAVAAEWQRRAARW